MMQTIRGFDVRLARVLTSATPNSTDIGHAIDRSSTKNNLFQHISLLGAYTLDELTVCLTIDGTGKLRVHWQRSSRLEGKASYV